MQGLWFISFSVLRFPFVRVYRWYRQIFKDGVYARVQVLGSWRSVAFDRHGRCDEGVSLSFFVLLVLVPFSQIVGLAGVLLGYLVSRDAVGGSPPPLPFGFGLCVGGAAATCV